MTAVVRELWDEHEAVVTASDLHEPRERRPHGARLTGMAALRVVAFLLVAASLAACTDGMDDPCACTRPSPPAPTEGPNSAA